jgi:uncharacterized membrane protein
MTGRRTAQVLLTLGGMIAWALQFTIIYGATSTLCGRGWAGSTLLGIGIVQAIVAATTLVALVPTALMLLMLLRAYKHADDEGDHTATFFMMQAGILINGFSLVVILWHGVPAFILPACA